MKSETYQRWTINSNDSQVLPTVEDQSAAKAMRVASNPHSHVIAINSGNRTNQTLCASFEQFEKCLHSIKCSAYWPAIKPTHAHHKWSQFKSNSTDGAGVNNWLSIKVDQILAKAQQRADPKTNVPTRVLISVRRRESSKMKWIFLCMWITTWCQIGNWNAGQTVRFIASIRNNRQNLILI